jgi:hypothetical protein
MARQGEVHASGSPRSDDHSEDEYSDAHPPAGFGTQTGHPFLYPAAPAFSVVHGAPPRGGCWEQLCSPPRTFSSSNPSQQGSAARQLTDCGFFVHARGAGSSPVCNLKSPISR